MGKQVFSVDDLSDGDISRLFFRARSFLAGAYPKKSGTLLSAFFEPSTRTRLSFERAAQRLGMQTSFLSETSSMVKGESIADTVATLLALEPDVFICRQAEAFERSWFKNTTAAVINAGDGCCEHPSQALLDCFTLLNHFVSDDLCNKRILIIGDIAYSRVARSNIKLLKRLGAEVVLMPVGEVFDESDVPHIKSFVDIDEPIHAVMCLRLQKERHVQTIDEQDFIRKFCLDNARFNRLGDCVLLHPGPVNYGVELMKEVAEHKNSLIITQVKNGVAVRAALIEHCL